MVQALEDHFGRDKVVAIMLATVLSATQEVVLNFTEILAFFVDPTQHPRSADGIEEADDRKQVLEYWRQLQDHAVKNDAESNKVIKKYTLEAGRLSNKMKLVRTYTAKEPINIPGQRPNKYGEPENTSTIEKNDTILVDLFAASHDEKIFPEPYKFKSDREATYLIYGDDIESHRPAIFSKHLSMTAVAGMLKHIVTLTNLRVAHDKLGRLKRVMTPNGVVRYCDVQWRLLLPYPVTWNLRFDSIGSGVYEGEDNADQGHGMNQTWEIGNYAAVVSAEETVFGTEAKEKPAYTSSYPMTAQVKSMNGRVMTTTTREITHETR